MTLYEYPIAHIMTTAASMDRGMDVATIREAFTSPKNRNSTIVEITMARAMVLMTELMELSTMSALSLTTLISTLGFWAMIFATASST